MKQQRALHFLLAMVMLVSMSTIGVSAASFNDIDGHWAEAYIEDVYSQGLVSGYEDGTFGPENTLTFCEALIFCSRVAGLSTYEKYTISSKWYQDVYVILPSSVASWAYSELSVCLELGIVSYDELVELSDSGDLTSAITRQELALYLTRAIQLDGLAESLTSYSLSFYDTYTISTAYRPYIYLLNSYGIIQGNDDGYFYPQNTLTRAQMATMLSLTLDLIEEEDILFELISFADYSSWFSGTITSVSTASTGITTLSITSGVNGSKNIIIPVSASIYLFNMSSNHSAFSVGDHVRVNYGSTGAVTSVIIGGETTSYSGTISALSEESITILTSSGYETFEINCFTDVSARNQTGDYSIIDLTADYTSATCTVNQLSQLTSLSLLGGSQTIDGVFSGTTTSGVQITGLDGVTYTYPTASDMVILVNGATYSYLYSSLSGSYIVLDVSNDTGEIISAQVDTTTTCIQGSIRSYDDDDDPREITITDLSVSENTLYYVSDTASFFYDGEEIDMDDLEKYWFATLFFDDGEVILVWCTTGDREATGTLIDISYGSMTSLDILLTDNTSVTYSISLSNLPTIYRNGSSSSIDKLRAGDLIELEVEDNEVVWIEATSQTTSVTGTISGISKTSSGTIIEVEYTDGTSESYSLSSNASITWDDTDISSSSLEIDYEISFIVINDQIVSIEVEDSPSSSSNFLALIISTDSSAGTFTIQLSDGSGTVMTIDVNGSTFYKAATGKTTSFSSFDPGEEIYVNGSYYNGVFYATMTILQ